MGGKEEGGEGGREEGREGEEGREVWEGRRKEGREGGREGEEGREEVEQCAERWENRRYMHNIHVHVCPVAMVTVLTNKL